MVLFEALCDSSCAKLVRRVVRGDIFAEIVNLLDLVRGLFACLVRGLVRGLVRSLVRSALNKTLNKNSAAEVSCSITCASPAPLRRCLVRGLFGMIFDGIFFIGFTEVCFFLILSVSVME